jgi:hypothetical protein
MPDHHISKPKEDATVLSEREMKMYRTGVGMLLYLVYSITYISNAIRELIGMKEATVDAMKELKRVINLYSVQEIMD